MERDQYTDGDEQVVRIGVPVYPGSVAGQRRLNQGDRYTDAIEAARGVVVLLCPDVASLAAKYRSCDGICIPGGDDIDPSRYGAARDALAQLAAPERDETEITLAQWAYRDGKPILGICRGHQVLNVALGGGLHQHLPAVVGPWRDHVDGKQVVDAHEIFVEAGTRLAGAIGTGTTAVNSAHHQGVKWLGRDLIVSARATDGVVEGIEARDHPFFVGVQFHPEVFARSQTWARDVFNALISASSASRAYSQAQAQASQKRQISPPTATGVSSRCQ